MGKTYLNYEQTVQISLYPLFTSYTTDIQHPLLRTLLKNHKVIESRGTRVFLLPLKQAQCKGENP